MKIKLLVTFVLFLISKNCFSQANPFHTLNFPSTSPKVVEMQKIGVTEIEISYHSPALRGRDVWNDPNVIPQNAKPIAWRAGANMNTTISFSTDVLINDNMIKAGTYGFHVIPKGDVYTLLFAHHNNQWGSYYLDIDNDITLRVDVKGTVCEKTEQLDYEFIDRTENSVVIALEWDKLRLPFTVSVDLNTTVVHSFRNELRGVNTYRWQAWNDAANWCLQHDTNLEEALTWVERSINGGYNGFAANKNLTNITTKARILKKLNKTADLQQTILEGTTIHAPPYDFNNFILFLLSNGFYEKALATSENASDQHPDTWYIKLNEAVCQYYAKKKSKKTFVLLKEAFNGAPEGYKPRIKQITKEIQNDTYVLQTN